MLLSDEERQKFIAWLTQDIESDTQIIRQMDEMNIPDRIAKLRRIEQQAKLVVLRILKSTSTETIT